MLRRAEVRPGTAFLLVLGLALAGCVRTTDGATRAAPTDAPAATVPASQPASPSASQAPSVPADWQVIDLEVATVRVPPDVEVRMMAVPISYSVRVEEGQIGFGSNKLFGDISEEDEVTLTLEEVEQDIRDYYQGNDTLQFLERRDVNGVEMVQYVVREEMLDIPARWLHAEHGDRKVMLSIQSYDRTTFPPREYAIFDQVLSTIEWLGDQPG